MPLQESRTKHLAIKASLTSTLLRSCRVCLDAMGWVRRQSCTKTSSLRVASPRRIHLEAQQATFARGISIQASWYGLFIRFHERERNSMKRGKAIAGKTDPES